MGTLISDEQPDGNSRGGIVVGKVEFMSPDARVPPVIRSISRLAIDQYQGRQSAHPALTAAARSSASAQPVMIGKVMPDPVPNLRTSAPCERCADKSRLGHSHLCADCIAEKAAANRGFLDREISPRDFLMMCVLTGLLIFCIARFGAPETKVPTGRKIQERSKF